MHLYIDSNIFLNFYGYSDDNLEELNKLALLIERGEITLYIPSQVKIEVEKNREAKIKEAYKNFVGLKPERGIPYIFRLHKNFQVLSQSLNDFYEAKQQIIAELKTDIKEKKLKADSVIKELFSKGKNLDSDKYIKLAKLRVDLQSPPGKKGLLGDAINWECLLDNVPNKNNLFFITKDSDFQSPMYEDQFNTFLFDEWQSKKKSEIFFYQSLGRWAREHQKDIMLKLEDEKNSLIVRLLQSGTYAETHLIIEDLSKHKDFSISQIEQIISAGAFNGQISSILSDEDVKKFYKDLIAASNEKELNPEPLAFVKKGISDEDPEIPF